MAHLPPIKKRQAVARYEALARDIGKGPALAQVAAEVGVSVTSVSKWRETHKPDSHTTVNAPFVITPGEAKVELTREVTTEAFISDIHWHPEHKQGHDPAAYDAALEMLKLIQPDIVYFGGDILDCYAPSRYDKVPRLATPEAFDGEIAYGRERLQEVCDALPNARKIWLTGNHELRLPRSVQANAPWLVGRMQDIENLLGLSSFGVEFVDDGHQIGKLRHYHGHNLAGAGRVNTAKAKFERMLTNLIYGHHHKFAKWYQRDQDGGYFGAFGNGTLHWLSAEYAHNPDWTQGFSVVQYARSGRFHIDQVLIHKPSVWSPHAEVIYAGNHVTVNRQ
jgi:hypothetical protein